jgi:hypothetical protein
MISLFTRIIVGLFFGIICLVPLLPAIAAVNIEGPTISIVVSFIVIATLTVLGAFAPTIRRAFGRGFLILGLTFFALPLSSLLLSGRAAQEVIATSADGTEAAAAVGAGISIALITGIGTFVGLIVGFIFVILGLVLTLGGRREVIVVRR